MTEPRFYFAPHTQTFPRTAHPDLLDFHCRLPGYQQTPLVSVPLLAQVLGVKQVWVKDEQHRLGLPAYKILGASWATYRELQTRFGPFKSWETLQDLADQLKPFLPLTLVAATDGNHGRAVARTAHWLGLQAHILVPEDMVPARRKAIESEGATVEVIAGSYDDAVLAAAEFASERHLVISDTSWEGYTRVPGWVVEGYSTIFEEIDLQLQDVQAAQPDLVAVQMGVGSLAAAVIQHYAVADQNTRIVGVEPLQADCVLRSLQQGTLTAAPGPHLSSMAGLNCGHTSPLAWPFLQGGLSAAVAVPDAFAEDAMRLLAKEGVVSGESGAAGVAGLLALMSHPEAELFRENLGLTAESTVLVVSTEGATDPENHQRIVQG
ncbi:diaminopropionate ammonia-lyase [Deinococcus roseus]|uniref:PLP-dependent lyase/thiolase n=1 Tax=Deinococcus roseus TaxID=392414 RepID=A0ABQ2D340_9DEIO|nr:diaminopropionate ammonia-lyase [Deinococcus roseus]GGJ43262.1 PLP-dependent lyase/thiolase [Deinococcus roseus]